ncbi:MAG: sigma-54 interaction domain-containing protein [Candidatus Sumerlaeia bacterium]
MAKQSKKSLPANPTEAILESISDGVFTVDENWRVMSFNRAAEEITGIPRSEAIGRLCSEVFRSSMCETDCALRQTLHSEKPVINRTCYIIDAEGNRIPISVSTAVLRNEAGELIGGAETFRDLSEVEALRQELEGRAHMGELVSHNPQMQRLFEMAHTVADSDSTVLIEGETGTGKELLARGIHDLGPRSKEPFLALNCGALPDNLLESELFGYKKGAFTGAEKDKPGRFALAGKGTLFLDEIGEVSPAMQVRLLRVLQENVYEPLGSIRSEKTQARIIAATNRDLENMVQQGTFRQDLYYRINIVRMQLPPLRRRKEDIPLLARHFIERFNRLQNRKVQDLSPDAMSLLMAHDWPGNVRELENVIERAFVVCREGLIEIKHLPESMRGPEIAREGGANIESVRRIAERQSILNALERNDFNRQAAARDLGIHKATLYRKIKNLGIDLP